MGDAGAAAREAFLAGDAALALRALSGGDPDAAHHSNLGVASAALDLPAAALRHFATALVSEDFEGDSQQKSAIHYNAGLALLASGNFRAAFEHLGCAAQAHGAEPRLWLRLAECCARVRQNLVNESATRRSVVGARPKLEDSGPMSLQRASVYARHALRLVSAVRVSDDADDVSATARLQLAWIHLELADYSIALEWADCALSGAASPEQRDLARLYASDARMHLGYNDVERDSLVSKHGSTLPAAHRHCAAAIILSDETALRHAEAAVEAEPVNDSAAIETLVALLVLAGRPDAAENALEQRPARADR